MTTYEIASNLSHRGQQNRLISITWSYRIGLDSCKWLTWKFQAIVYGCFIHKIRTGGWWSACNRVLWRWRHVAANIGWHSDTRRDVILYIVRPANNQSPTHDVTHASPYCYSHHSLPAIWSATDQQLSLIDARPLSIIRLMIIQTLQSKAKHQLQTQASIKVIITTREILSITLVTT